MAKSFYGPGAASVSLVDAVQRHDRAKRGVDAQQEDGVAPPGWERSIKRMKKHKDIDNPYSLSWWLRRRGAKPAKHEDAADPEFDAVLDHAMLLNKKHQLPKEYTAAAKGEVWAQSLLLDPNLPPLVVEIR